MLCVCFCGLLLGKTVKEQSFALSRDAQAVRIVPVLFLASALHAPHLVC